MKLHNEDCIEQMQKMINEGVQVDSVVTDPPYELNFMNKSWDSTGIAFQKETWELAFQLLKPGGHLLAFAGSRTYHRIAVAIEDAGFEIRDQIMWLYGSGFPKSLNIGKAIDKRRSSNNVIRPWLKSLGSREELAKVAKVSPRQIDHYIGENTPCPQTLTYERFILICDYYKSYPEWSDDMFPKVGKKIGEKIHGRSGGEDFAKIVGSKSTTKTEDITESATDEAKQWEGWGTALKPAHEPVVMARKPVEGTVAENVLKHGTGGINIDECRVEVDDNDSQLRTINRNQRLEDKNSQSWGMNKTESNTEVQVVNPEGRFPANVMHDGSDEVLKEFPHTKSGKDINPTTENVSGFFGQDMGYYSKEANYGDDGSAARFFYCPKVSKSERNRGLDNFEEKKTSSMSGRRDPHDMEKSKIDNDVTGRFVTKRKNVHPTVKPVELMKYLCRLVTPKGGIVLDPFMGIGTTGMAAKDE